MGDTVSTLPPWAWVLLVFPWSILIVFAAVIALAARRMVRTISSVFEVANEAPKSRDPEPFGDRDCRSCDHFDHAGGQESLRERPAMREVVETVSPHRITGELHGASWDEFGGCRLRLTILHPSEACDRHTKRCP